MSLLHFYATIEACLQETQPDVALLSGVLQYLQDPYAVLEQILDIDCDLVIIDRTLFWDGQTDRLCVRTVPPNIYKASYPNWIFSKKQFQAFLLKENWEIQLTFESLDNPSAPVELSSQGMYIVKK